MRNALRIAALFATALLLAASPSAADGLDAAKKAGWLGEMPDGRVGLVRDDAPADVKALADQINEGRLKRYQQIAQQNGIPPKAVAAQAGAKLIERAAPGEFVWQDGGWVRKK